MKSIIHKILALAKKYNGIVYDILFILYSWFYGLLFRHLIVGESTVRFFERGHDGINYELFIVMAVAAVSEIVGGYFIVHRIRHVRTHPELYAGIINQGKAYIEGDSIIFFKLWLVACRVTLSAYVGYIAFSALGLGKLSALGCFAWIVKDIVLLWAFTKMSERQLHERPARILRGAAVTLLAFTGMVYASAGFEAFMSRSYDVLCNFHHWTGVGNFVLSLLLYFLFFSILYIPTRLMYYVEELEFTDSREDAWALRKSFLITAALSIIPWLF